MDAVERNMLLSLTRPGREVLANDLRRDVKEAVDIYLAYARNLYRNIDLMKDSSPEPAQTDVWEPWMAEL